MIPITKHIKSLSREERQQDYIDTVGLHQQTPVLYGSQLGPVLYGALGSGVFRAENRRVQFMSNYCNSTQFAQNCSKLTGAISLSQKSTGAFAPVTPL